MQQNQKNVHAQNYAVCCSDSIYTMNIHIGNGYAYSNVYRYIFRNTLHYSLSICIRIGYIWKKSHYFSCF